MRGMVKVWDREQNCKPIGRTKLGLGDDKYAGLCFLSPRLLGIEGTRAEKVNRIDLVGESQRVQGPKFQRTDIEGAGDRSPRIR